MMAPGSEPFRRDSTAVSPPWRSFELSRDLPEQNDQDDDQDDQAANTEIHSLLLVQPLQE
jgi:hypothetical protein